VKEKPVRKCIRLDGYDYSAVGYYFITICVKDKHEMLGGEVVVGDDGNRSVKARADCHPPLWQSIPNIDENPARWTEDEYFIREQKS